MNQKWNLQDIRPIEPRRRTELRPRTEPERSTPPPVIERDRDPDNENDEEIGTITISNGKKQSRLSLILALVVFFAVIGGGVIFSLMTAGADVTVHPRHADPNVNATFTAYNAPKTGELSYELMSLDAEGERQVNASGTQEAHIKARGTIFIYNKYQTSPVKLVVNTRFQSPDGLIYRIDAPATVPGYTKDSSGKIIPGVVAAKVTADQEGDTYNIQPSHFTIPGFKGDPEYDGVYGESTDAMTGGFSGKKFIIGDADMQAAQQGLRTDLRNSLLARIDKEKPAGFTVFKDAVTFTYTTEPAVAYGDGKATIKEKAVMRIPIFKDADFASFIAKATIPGYENLPVRIDDPSTLTFSYVSATTSASDISAVPSINFKLIGKAALVWTFDHEKFKADLANKRRTALPSILSAYPGIESASAKIRPFWKSTFPIKLEKIQVHEEILPNTSP